MTLLCRRGGSFRCPKRNAKLRYTCLESCTGAAEACMRALLHYAFLSHVPCRTHNCSTPQIACFCCVLDVTSMSATICLD